jgi:hypothetical protein
LVQLLLLAVEVAVLTLQVIEMVVTAVLVVVETQQVLLEQAAREFRDKVLMVVHQFL